MALVNEEPYRSRIAACIHALWAARYAREDNAPCQIEEGLFIGSVGAALNKDALKAANVTHVLIVARSLSPAFPDDFVYKKIEVLDSTDTNLEEHFDDCFAFIDEARSAGGSVLVHCFAGRSRSATIIIAYLMMKHRMTLSDALTLVKSKRPQICPNQGFMVQLENFEKSLGVLDTSSPNINVTMVHSSIPVSDNRHGEKSLMVATKSMQMRISKCSIVHMMFIFAMLVGSLSKGLLDVVVSLLQ